jgi:hypothetical protein
MARKNQKGRSSRICNVQEKVKELRDFDLSFTEIGAHLGISRQLARYHYYIAVDKSLLTKK